MTYNVHGWEVYCCEYAADERCRAFGLSFEFGGLSCGKILQRFEASSSEFLVLPYKLEACRDHAINADEGTGSFCSEELIEHLNTIINYFTKYVEHRLS